MTRTLLLILERGRRRLRSVRKSFQLKKLVIRLDKADRNSTLLFATVRNEMPRLAQFLTHYRNLGIGHFCFVDNGSSDGGCEFLARQNDCSVWQTNGSYRAANFGVDWINFLLNRYAHGRWILAVDVDELLVYPHCDSRDLPALTHWLEIHGQHSFSAMQIDLYSKVSIQETNLAPGQDPLEVTNWFDASNYTYRRNPKYRNLWILGGPRQRAFFRNEPENAPALNKIPLVNWRRGYVFVSSSHVLLPTFLNVCYAVDGGELACGCLLHTKLVGDMYSKATEELDRQQHFANGREYRAFLAADGNNVCLWSEHSTPYHNWRTLEKSGLLSSGGWL